MSRKIPAFMFSSRRKVLAGRELEIECGVGIAKHWFILNSFFIVKHETKTSQLRDNTLETRDGKTRLGPPAETGRAWPENPGPRALRAETGLMIFYLRFLCGVCALCTGQWVVTSELCIVVTCKCVVYWSNVHENETVVCACNLLTRYN